MEQDFALYANRASQYGKAAVALVLAQDAISKFANESDGDQEAKDLLYTMSKLQLRLRKEQHKNEQLADDLALDDLPY